MSYTRRLLRSVWVIFMFIVALVFVTFLLIRFLPQQSLLIINHFVDVEINAAELKTTYFPLSVEAKDFSLKDERCVELSMDKMAFSFAWWSYFRGKQNSSITLDILNGQANIHSSCQASGNQGAVEKETASPELFLSFLSSSDGVIENLSVSKEGEKWLDIKAFTVNQDKHTIGSTNVSVDMVLWEELNQLTVSGEVKLKQQEDKTKIQLVLAPLDFRPIQIKKKESGAIASVSQSSDKKINKEHIEPELGIDWRWMNQLKNIDIQLIVPQIDLLQLRVFNIDCSIEFSTRTDKPLGGQFNQEMQLKPCLFTTRSMFSNSLYYQDEWSVDGVMRPLLEITNNQDIGYMLNIQSKLFKIESDGMLNLNSLTKSHISFNIKSIHEGIENKDKFEFISEKWKARSNISIDPMLQQVAQYLPVDITGKIKTGEDSIVLDNVKAIFGDSNIKATIQWVFTERGETIDADIFSEHFSYYSPENSNQEKTNTQLHSVNTQEETLNQVVDHTVKKEEQPLGKTKIDWSWLHSMGLEAKLEVDELIINNTRISKLVAPISLTSKGLKVNKMTADFAEGKTQLDVVIAPLMVLDDKINEVAIDVSAVLEQLDLSQIQLFDKKLVEQGNLSAVFDLQFQGASIAQLMANANGHFYIDAKQVEMPHEALESIGSDLLVEVISKLNPFVKKDKFTLLECGIIVAPIVNGVINLKHNLGLKTSKILIDATGNVDLAKQKLNVKLTPTARKGIGLSVGNLVKFIKIGGSLTSPKPILDGAGLLETGLIAGAALSTGGASLVATDIISKATTAEMCQRLRKKIQEQFSGS